MLQLRLYCKLRSAFIREYVMHDQLSDLIALVARIEGIKEETMTKEARQSLNHSQDTSFELEKMRFR